MVIRFAVERIFDLPDRALMASGLPLHGVIEAGMVLGDGTGARTTVLAVEFQSPADRRLGQVTLALERTTPSPVSVGTVLSVEGGPTIEYQYRTTASSLSCTDSRGTMIFDRDLWHWRYAATTSPPAGSRVVPRSEAEHIARAMGTALPTPEQLRRMILDGEAQSRPT